jgi:hypothetical protein
MLSGQWKRCGDGPVPKKFVSDQEKRTYQSWADMRNRCRNARHRRYGFYGGRGIKVCERWDSFAAFVEDLGLKPDGLTLERLDNNGDYEPDNCKWATYREQNKNTRSTTVYEYRGRRQTIEEWADEVGMPRSTLSERIHGYGWDISVALTAQFQHKENIPDDPELAKYLPKLTREQADEIRELYAEGGWSYRGLGELFGVSGTSVSRIVRGEVWK